MSPPVLSDRERRCLIDMAEQLAPDFYWPFSLIQERCAVEPGDARRVVRALARKGMTQFRRGLFTEDGEVAGSGYGVTDAGYAFAEAARKPAEAAA